MTGQGNRRARAARRGGRNRAGERRPWIKNVGGFLVCPEQRLNALTQFRIRRTLLVEKGSLLDGIRGFNRLQENGLGTFRIDGHDLVLRQGTETVGEAANPVTFGGDKDEYISRLTPSPCLLRPKAVATALE